MTIPRIKLPDWGIGDKLTSAELNDLDTNVTYALDKRSGETDTLESTITCSGAGRIIQTVATGADANTTYQVNAANAAIRVTSAVTASRTYTLSATGASTGDVVTVFCESSFSSSYEILVKDQASATMFSIGNGDSADGQWAQFIYVGGWRLFRGGQGSRTRSQTFTSSGSWTCPRSVTTIMVFGCGGGGGGGGGASGSTTLTAASDSQPCGGGGGGGAEYCQATAAVTPGNSYTATPGAGGTGGTVNSPGVDGSDSTFGSLVTFAGAQGGFGAAFASDLNVLAYHEGGRPVRLQPNVGVYRRVQVGPDFGYEAGGLASAVPASGGYGLTRLQGATDAGHATAAALGGRGRYGGFAGGSGGGSDGSNNGGYSGGGRGGGGGAGPYGVGAAGGAGGNAATSGDAGSAGSAASANTGAGGGGGGAGGCGSTSGGTGGAGGDGGSGQITVLWVK